MLTKNLLFEMTSFYLHFMLSMCFFYIVLLEHILSSEMLTNKIVGKCTDCVFAREYNVVVNKHVHKKFGLIVLET